MITQIIQIKRKNEGGDNSGESIEQLNVSCQLNRLFGREKPVYHLLSGGKSTDVLLWRNKISASVISGLHSFGVAKQGENDLGVLLCVHTISNLSG
ncbi:hypothetical protein MKW98_015867 [Papaver atlanticum]|uniref:Uncharacterized protein n=1 Tax=Papaver atlanticum TaxID=357466 RepID=A0AAD4XKL7_9MAGN|nr:hypothetical protein MKW98_015867 [Papaver atlanticum]